MYHSRESEKLDLLNPCRIKHTAGVRLECGLKSRKLYPPDVKSGFGHVLLSPK